VKGAAIDGRGKIAADDGGTIEDAAIGGSGGKKILGMRRDLGIAVIGIGGTVVAAIIGSIVAVAMGWLPNPLDKNDQKDPPTAHQ
jgi:hypothetical protein